MKPKTIERKSEKIIPTKIKQKISLEEFRNEFGEDGIGFSDEQLEKIRDFFYVLAAISYEQYLRVKESEESVETKVINLNEQYENKSAKSYSLHPREYRRTG